MIKCYLYSLERFEEALEALRKHNEAWKRDVFNLGTAQDIVMMFSGGRFG